MIILLSFLGVACLRCSIITHEINLDRNTKLSLVVPEGPNKKRCLCENYRVASKGYCEEAWWNDSLAICVSRDNYSDSIKAYSIIYLYKDEKIISDIKRQDFSTLEELNVELKKKGLGKSNLKHRGYLFRKYRDDLIFDD